MRKRSSSRGRTYTVDQQYGRSLPRDRALSDEPLLAYALGGEPLTPFQGRPLRLLVPGWYGAPNVKYLSEIHVQEDQYLGKYQARWYRTLKGEMVNGEMKWKETAITRMRLKSYIARVTERGGSHNVFGVIMHDGTPIRSVEVKVDDGDWQPATLEPGDHGRALLVEVLQLHVGGRDARRAHRSRRGPRTRAGTCSRRRRSSR